jgi:hypothetical protein
MKKLFCFLLFLIILASSQAQEFGGNPPSTRWKQVNTDTFRIIFPTGLDSVAQRIANMANAINGRTMHTIGNHQKKINILLQNATTISNGYVALGPFRSEFELLPQQNSFDLGSLPWPDNLVIHEWRHVQQYSNFNHGLSKAFFILFGQEGQALANGLAVPDWFFEGDAVFQETLVSEQGRGRMPAFFNGYRSIWEAGRNYSWMKLRNGSLRDYTPDHYRLGYMLVAYGREKYGPEFWKNVTHDAASFSGLFYPMQKGVKRATGKSYKDFTNEALTYFKDKLADSAARSSTKEHFIADEEYPYWMDSTRVVYMRSSYDRIPQFTIRENGKDQKLRVRDISIDNYFSYHEGKIVYAAYQPDIRWGRVDYSDIKLLDIKTKKEISLTHRAKYFAPEISPDGNTIVAVHVDELGRSALHLLDMQGKLKREIPNPSQLFYTYPKFYGDNKILSAVRNRAGQMSLAIVDMSNGLNSYLLPFTFNVIGFPSIVDGVIYFSASNGNFDRLYQIKDGELSEVLRNGSSSTGDYQLNVSNGKMVWTHFTDRGYQLRYSELIKNSEKPNAIQPDATHFGLTALEKPENSLLSLRNDTSYPVKHYSQSFHLLNFHSREPYIDDPDYTFSFVSENILNTLQAEAFVTYNRNEGYTQFGASAIYSQLFPWLNLSSDYTIDRNVLLVNRPNRVYWDEWETSGGFSVPLNLTKGRSFTSLTFGSDLVYNQRYFKGYYKDTFDNRAFVYLNNSVTFTNQIQQARKQIYPRLAQTVVLNYKGSVSNLVAQQFLASGSLYLPGAFITHSLVLQAAFQGRDSNLNVIYSNSFPFSRGYAVASFYRMGKVGANYHFPLLYPDWGFGQIVYFLRIRANMFYDFTRVQDFTNAKQLASRDFRSFGTEIFFDTKWWNQLPVSIGIRYSHLLDPDIDGRSPNQWEIVLPTNLLSRY